MYSVSFWAMWYEQASWSRIMDFGIAAGNHNLIIANEGGSSTFFVRAGKAGQINDFRCRNAIELKKFNHWAVTLSEDYIIHVYKDG